MIIYRSNSYIWLCMHGKVHEDTQTGGYPLKLLLIITTTLWFIWLDSTRKVFDNVMLEPAAICFGSARSMTVNYCETLQSCAIPRQLRLVSWTFPGTGKLKPNTDGSSRGNRGPAGFGGVFGEERGC